MNNLLTRSRGAGLSLPRFAGALLFAALLVVAEPKWIVPSAFAHSPISCMENGDYGQMNAVEAGAYNDQERGVRSDVWIYDDVDCQRVSSVWVEDTGGVGFFEFGYVLGWSSCDSQWHSYPTLFAWWRDTDYTSGCRIWATSHPVTGQRDELRASDTNGDFRWGGWWDGVELQPGTQGIVLSFDRGYGVANMERGGWYDSGRANFADLEEYLLTSSWTDFDDVVYYRDSDPDFHWVFPSDNDAIAAPD